MAGSKRGRALFEVIRKERGRSEGSQFDVPEWWTGVRPKLTEVRPVEDPVVPPPLTLVEDRPAESFAPAPTAETTTKPVAAEDRVIGRSDQSSAMAIDGRVVRLTMTSRTAAVVIFGVGLLMVTSYYVGRGAGLSIGEAKGFELGRSSVQADVIDDIQAARQAAPVDDLFEGIGASPVVRHEPTPGPEVRRSTADLSRAGEIGALTTPVWVADHTYIVVQDFVGGARDDAERAQVFLRDQNVPTVIIERSGRVRYQLVTLQGFDRKDAVQRKLSDEYLARIRQLGQEFFKAGGRYRLEGYFRTLKTDSW